MKNQEPKTWSELLKAGHVVELTEEQVGIARMKFAGPRSDECMSYANGDYENAGYLSEDKMRGES